MSDGNGYVTWKGFIASAGTLMVLVAGIISWSWNIHMAQPHPGAVDLDHFRDHQASVAQRLDRIEAKLDRVLSGGR